MAESESLAKSGHLVEATAVLVKALEYARRFTTGDPRLPRTFDALAALYKEQGKYEAAAGQYRQAIHLWELTGPENHEALLTSTDSLIGTYLQNKDFIAAGKLIKLRVPEMERSASSFEDRAALANMRASFALTQHHFLEAEQWFQESLGLWQQHHHDRNSAIALLNLAQVSVDMKHYQSALGTTLQAVGILEKLDARPLKVVSLVQAGALYMKLRRPEEACAAYSRALETAQVTFGPEHSRTCAIMLRYSAALQAVGQRDQAKAIATNAKTILARSKDKLTVDINEFGGFPR